MMPFEYRRAEDVDGALALVTENPGAAFLGGGTNLVDRMKLGVTNPRMVIDVSRLPLAGVEMLPDGGVRIGATVRNSDLAAHPVIRRRYAVLARALLAGASGQLRNAATTAGNLMQATRCVYFQDVTTPCNKREPGSGCSAVGGHVRYHAILGASDKCIAVHPSDMAVALAALDAVVVVRDRRGEHNIPVNEFYRLPGDSPEHDTVLKPDQLIVAVELPVPAPAALSTYVKTRDRASFAFALVSVAAEIELENGTVAGARIAIGGVAHRPWRAYKAEEVLLGSPPTEEVFVQAADAELANANPQSGNAFKIPLTRGVMVSVLRSLTTGGPT
ncbi:MULTISPECIES: FAD binding domain-containing protein [Rhodococcus]|uniref:FAD binding domain-containing protein n=1 Tax=Rhodococcus TaxID=1827 RepID=UPI001C9A567F|nr:MULTISPECIES: xanthine dehydrogenase family protein subunit M [Rhodococcus]MBY6382423.1 xanthine dehydrogenase family protein subunit M [Rhodococcus erythropolis]MDI9960604.1 xanthine dehydrogenase family protein subunit M [Rhodococcus sp. IEGM 1237]MDI9966642.1 xanthine dehydrogenase family protein subunit M [Rhodococcus sp. IEGM 1251]MDV8129011.1 xanthine dehydrogenase family protein subunit M [Rhodococcus sp. IEGM 1304]